MRIAVQSGIPELDTLLDRFRERRGLMPLKARALKGLAAELGAAYGIGLPWEPLAKSPNPQAKDGLFFSVPAL
jgi:hypothetical protein